MKNRIQIIFISFLLLTLNNLYCQTDNTKFYNEIFKWEISIPNSFENVGQIEAGKLQETGKKMLENSTGEMIENKSIKIYDFKNEKYNRLIVNYQQTESEENYKKRFEDLSNIMYESFKMKMPTSEIQHSLTSEKISGINFEVFDLKITYPNKMILFLKFYSTIINRKILNIQIAYQNEEKGQLLISAFRNSKFEN